MTIKKKIGRPTKFTAEIKEEILERLSNGETARSICRDDHMPHWSAFCKYKRAPENKEFLDHYNTTWRDGLTSWEQKILDVATDETRDYQPDGKGGVKSDNTSILRDRLKIDSMKWIMCKRMPDVYGDKVQTEHTGSVEFKEVVDRPARETPEAWQERVLKDLAQKQRQIVQ